MKKSFYSRLISVLFIFTLFLASCDESDITGTITASQGTIESGQTVTLSWSLSSNSSSVESSILTDDKGHSWTVSPNGSQAITPSATALYTITWTGKGKSKSESVTVTVVEPPSVTFTSDKTSVAAGESVMFSWTSNHATSCSIQPDLGNVELNGSRQVTPPAGTTRYTITATGTVSSATAFVDITASNAPSVTLTADKTTIEKNSPVTLTWVSDNAASCSIEPGIGSVGLNDSVTVTPLSTTTYVITATNSQGLQRTSQVTVTVIDPPIVTLTADKTTLSHGESVNLSWTSANAQTCEIQPSPGAVALSGSTSQTPETTTDYIITARGPLSSATATVHVNVVWDNPTTDFSAFPATIEYPGTATLMWTTRNASAVSIDQGVGSVAVNGSVTVSPAETTTYTLTASNPEGETITAQAIVTVEYKAPKVVQFSMSAPEIDHGDTVTLSWNVQNADKVFIGNGIGEVSATGSRDLTPDYTTTWSLTAYSAKGGTSEAKTSVKVLENPPAPLAEGLFGKMYEDLIPGDASLASYDEKRFIVVTGLVNDIQGNPLPDVRIEIFDHPEYGTAMTDDTGRFSIPAEGGGLIRLIYTKDGHITSHRQKESPWNDILVFDTITLIEEDDAFTYVVFNGDPDTVITHKSTEIIDPEFGNRSCTLVFKGDNMAYEVDANGNRVRVLPAISTRASEFTTPESMPAVLPPTSAYTYCAELKVDGAENIQFDKPVTMYVDNFLGFPVGGIVPVGYYDRNRGVWVPSQDGVVVQLLDTDNDGIVDALDATGDGIMDDLDNDGYFADEVEGLEDSSIYLPGNSYWRGEIDHFTPIDCNWPYGPPDDAVFPNSDGTPEIDSDDKSCFLPGTLVHSSHGARKIEEIAIGDFVWSYDEITGNTDLNKVTRIFVTPEQNIMDIMFDDEAGNSDTIGVTLEHPFWVLNQGWIPAEELKPGDRIHSLERGVITVNNLRRLNDKHTVYNFEVDKFHTYFVGKKGLLVHNTCINKIDPMKRILHEDIPIPGTDMTLHYASDRVGGYQQKIVVPVSGSSVPASLKRIVVNMSIAGRTFTKTLSPSPNQSAWFIWDGKDYKGNSVNGKIKTDISICFIYQAVYLNPWPNNGIAMAFGKTGSMVGEGIPARQEFELWRHDSLSIYVGNKFQTDLSNNIAKGWTFSIQHQLNKNDLSTLYKGDGTIVHGGSRIIKTVAGTGNESDTFSGDGGPAIDANLLYPRSIVSDASGKLFITDSYSVRMIDSNGIISTVAGTGLRGPDGPFKGDGGPATNAFIRPYAIALGSSGNLYITDSLQGRIFRVDKNGIITTVAGGGDKNHIIGDGVPATNAKLYIPTGIVFDASGNLFIADTNNNCIRMVDTNGIITTVAGRYSGYRGDGGPAKQASLSYPTGIAIDSAGNLYIADSNNGRIRKIDPAGIINTVGGNGQHNVSSGDGGPAVEAGITVHDITIDLYGNIFIVGNSRYEDCCNRIRMINNAGIITTIAGNGIYGSNGDGGFAIEASFFPTGITIDKSGDLYVADMDNRHIRKIAPISIFKQSSDSGEISFPESNGIGHIMSPTCLHKKTIDLNTGDLIYNLEYTDGKQLSSITNRFNKQTIIERNGNGTPTAIISPYGIKTELDINESTGQLEYVAYPDGSFYEFGYTDDGLMSYEIDPQQHRYDHTFDSIGRLTDAYDEEGGHWNYNRNTNTSGIVTSLISSAEGNWTKFVDQTDSTGALTSTTTESSGDMSVFTQTGDGINIIQSDSCDLTTSIVNGLDPEYKTDFVKNMTQTTPGGLSLIKTTNRTYVDTNTDAHPDLITETMTVNNKTTTLIQNVLTSTKVITTPQNRIIQSDYDPETLQATRVSVTGLNDVEYDYYPAGDLHYGRLHTIRSGLRESEFTYYDNGNLHTATDPEGNVTTYEHYDALGRIKDVRKPDGTHVLFNYDKNGNMTTLTTPSGRGHIFDYNGVDLASSYLSPLGMGTAYTYDKDRRPLSVLSPSGAEIIYDYNDGTGNKALLQHIITPEGSIDYEYSCGSNVESVSMDSQSVSWTYDGSLVTSETSSGDLTQTLSYTFNPDGDFNLDSFSYAGANVGYLYDNDGLLTGSGPYTIARKPENGLPTKVSSGTYALDRDFSAFGETNSETFTIGGSPIGSWNVTERDQVGRILAKTETLAGSTTTFSYSYDENGRLETVTRNGVLTEEYRYDAFPFDNCSFRTSTLRGAAGEIPTYDADDRMTGIADRTYSFDDDGRLTQKVRGSVEQTLYHYSSRGELLNVTLPNGDLIEYIHDPLGRRIAKKINGTTLEKYLWQGQTRLLAVYDDADNLLMRFQYADGRMPVSMTRGGQTYYLIFDQTGSLKAVADINGTVVKAVLYDSFGFIVSDSNPALDVPFGFAGGLHDVDTGLVRFGFRDYDPEIGRWTAKDPIGFAGGDTDLYGYVLSDPVDFVDPLGLWTFQFGLTASGQAGLLSGNWSIGIIFDGNGNVGWYDTVGAGVGVGADGSVGFTFSTSSGECIDDMSGPFANASASLGAGLSGSLDAFSGPGSQGQTVIGEGFTLGVGAGGGWSLGGSQTWIHHL
ncbi:MAG: polymorphic toxin-type HINT domain-containing protein [Desulfobacteraceae bacterium]|jgi:RHS repeat-associated protein